MRYNEKIFFNGNDGSGTEVLWNNIGGAFASSNFTFSLVHLGRNSDDIQTIFDITQSPYTDYIRLYRNNSGRYYVYIENNNDTQTIYQYGTYANDAKYNHIVFTCNGSKWCFYINGYKVKENSITHTTAHLDAAHTDMRVGMTSTGDESYRAVGIIDELSLWNTALTYDEVKELYADSVVKDATTHSKSANLIGYWRNDGVTQWIDRSTNSNHGTVSGNPDSITIREGLNSNKDGLGFPLKNPSSNVIRLNGSSEYVDAGSTKSLDDMWHGGGTILMWLKPQGSTTNMGIMNKAGNGNQGWMLKTDGALSSGAWRFRFDVVFSGATYSWQCTGGLPVNEWNHYAIVLNSTDGQQMTVYKNGEVLPPTNSPSNTNGTYVSDAGQDLIIGSKEALGTKYNGLMDEIMFYNKALTVAEINKNHKFSKGKHKND